MASRVASRPAKGSTPFIFAVSINQPVFTMHPRNFSPHHPVTTFKIGEWHYNRVRKGNLDDGLADPSRGGVDAQGIVDGRLRRFGAGGLAHMHGRPVGASEGGSDALLTFEDSTKRRPTGAVTGWTQAGPDHLYELIRDHGDEQMAVGANRFVVVDGAQAELGFQ